MAAHSSGIDESVALIALMHALSTDRLPWSCKQQRVNWPVLDHLVLEIMFRRSSIGDPTAPRNGDLEWVHQQILPWPDVYEHSSTCHIRACFSTPIDHEWFLEVL